METEKTEGTAEEKQTSNEKDVIEELHVEDIENDTSEKEKLDSATLNVNLDNATLNVNLDSEKNKDLGATLNIVNLDTSTLSTLNLDATTETLKEVKSDSETLNADLDSATLNANLDSATSNIVNLDISTLSTLNFGATPETLKEVKLDSETLNADLDSATLNANLDSETLNADLDSATLNANLDSTTSDIVNLDSSILNTHNLDPTKLNNTLEGPTINESNINENDGPSHVINIPDLNVKMSKVYEVNGSTFVESERLSTHDNDTLARYELYKMVKSPKEQEEVGEDDMSSELETQIQTLPHGVIINSNVFLWDAHWHTMALVDGNVFCCAVCRVYCDRATLLNHVETVTHRRNLDEYKPLKRFDLSIVRKINENFHCGVCNEIFDIIDYKTHENSKTHEGNLLTAINKVSDLMYDSNLPENLSAEKKIHTDRTIQDYGRNAMSYGRNSPSITRNTSTRGRNSPSHGRNSPSHGRNTPSHGRNTPEAGNQFFLDANAFPNNFQVYSEFSASDEEYSFEGDEYNTPFEGVSYASMASKPTIALPKFLKIDLGTKEVRVKYESWHMIVKIELNKFYCMVCNKQDLIRYKSQHCIGCEHVERLAKCTVVKAYEDYLIRKVDDKLYHCGHCNNLHYQNQMTDHVENAHPKKTKNIIDTAQSSPLKTKKSVKTVDKNNTKPEKVPEPKSKSETERSSISNEFKAESISPNFDIFGDVTISPFGTNLKISALSLNFIVKKGEDYYCAICDKACPDVKTHVEEFDHMESMSMTPFIRPFKCNLIRAVRGTLHCSLCNELLSVTEMYTHNIDQPHTNALAAALGMRKNHKPNLNTTKNEKNDTCKPSQKIDQNKPDTAQKLEQNKPELTLKMPVSNQNVDKTGMESPQMSQSPQLNTDLPNSQQKLPSPASNPQTVSKETLTDSVLKISASQTNSSKNTSPNSDVNKMDASQNSSASNSAQTGAQFNFNVGTNFNYGSNFNNSGQNFPNSGQNLPISGQNLPNSGRNLPISGRNLPISGQNLPFPGQNVQNYPSIYNAMLPILQSQNLNQYLSAPLNYGNFNRPRTPFPFSYIPPLSSNLNNYNISANKSNISSNNNLNTTKNQNLLATAEKAQAKKNIDSANGKENIRSSDNIIRSGDEIIKPSDDGSQNVTIDSIVSQSDDDEFKEFDEEELVFVKLKTTYFKITNLSYNTLIYMDHGVRHCFVCSSTIRSSFLRKHVESREHTENISKNKVLDKYGVQLFRQMYLMYHCAICNVLMSRKEIKHHLDWTDHIECYDSTHIKLNKKNRKALKSGIKEYVVGTQREAIFHNVNEPRINVVDAYEIVLNSNAEKDDDEKKPSEGSKATPTKRNKMVIISNVVMKVGFDHWHGITSVKNVTKCVICQVEIGQDEVLDHVQSDYHCVALGKTFEKSYYPALIRKINENTVNCMICNLELSNSEYLIHEHVNGRKHSKNHDGIVNESSNSDSYADCYEDYLTL